MNTPDDDTLNDDEKFIFASTALYFAAYKELTWEDIEKDMIVAKLTHDVLESEEKKEISVMDLWYLILESKYAFARVNLDEGLVVIKGELYEIDEIPGLSEDTIPKLLTEQILIDYKHFQVFKSSFGIAFKVQIARLWEDIGQPVISKFINQSLEGLGE